MFQKILQNPEVRDVYGHNWPFLTVERLIFFNPIETLPGA